MRAWCFIIVYMGLMHPIEPSHRVRHSKHHHFETFQNDGGDADESPFVYVSISEVNIDSGSPVPKRFVELYATRNPNRHPSAKTKIFTGWRLLMIRGTTMEIVMSIDLAHHLPHPDSPFITIGDPTVPNVNINLASTKAEVSFTVTTFPNMDTSPYALVVVKAEDPISSELMSLPKNNQKYEPIDLSSDEYRQKLIADSAYDVVVIGRRVATNQCDYFSYLFPSQSFKNGFNYLLRDLEAASSSVNDYSLNFCCKVRKPYSPSCFKLGHPSPGTTNDCSGRRFVLEYEMNRLEQTRQSNLFIDIEEGFCKNTFPGIEPYRYNLVHDHDYAMAVARVMQRPVCDQPTEYMETDEDPMPAKTPSVRPLPEQPKKYISDFDETEFALCKEHFSRPEDLNRPMYTSWLHLKSEPGKCLITCRICKQYFEDGWRPDQKHKHYIQQGGFWSDKIYTNKKTVVDHLEQSVHAEAVFFYSQLESASTRAEQLRIEQSQVILEKRRLRPTMNEVRLGYTEIRSDVPFKRHGTFMTCSDELGVNVGFKHRHEKSLTLLSVTISKCFHKNLLEHLVEQRKFFSLICDGTTNKNIPYLVCLIQTLEDGKPIVYFWGLLVITTGESGYSMVEDLKIRISEDDKIVPGFENYFKSHIIASVSDSASNMVGSRNSFYAYLGRYVGRSLALVKCGAHKLQRAIIHAIDFPTDEPSANVEEKHRQRFFKSFLKINNQFYTFYMSRGSKRFQEFIELAEEMEIPAYRINYFFDIRWAASHKICMETMFKNYDALREDLNRIVAHANFDQNAKSKARELQVHILDKTFPVVVAEFVDFLTIFQVMSLRFQSKGGIMIGNADIIRSGYKDFETLRNEPGAYVESFLSKCSCPGVCTQGECSLVDYDNCPVVTRHLKDDTHVLTQRTDGQHTIKLSQFRTLLYDKILQQLLEYFQPDTLQAFEVFNPKNFKPKCGEASVPDFSCNDLSSCYEMLPTILPNGTPKSPEDNIAILCSFYGISNPATIINEWKQVLAVIIQDAKAQTIRQEDPARYWPVIVQRTDIPMTNNLKGIIERILVTAFTSADAERAFSMVTRIKSPQRTNLSPKTLENLVRIRFNGPESLSEEKLFEYTKAFVKVSSRVDDATVVGGQPPSPEAYKKFFSKSKLF